MQNNTVIMEIDTVISQKLKKKSIIRYACTTSGFILKNIKSHLTVEVSLCTKV